MLRIDRFPLAAMARRARERRAALFRATLAPKPGMRILDLGGGNGSHIARILPHHDPRHVTVADISEWHLAAARREFRFDTVRLNEHAPTLPFDDAEFDICFCSSVIEHISVPKTELATCQSERVFRDHARANQRAFASEVRRIAKGYFVQTPYKYFPLESHSLLPMPVVLLPRPQQVAVITRFSKYRRKRATPDFLLFTRRELSAMFPDAQILSERWFGMTKSIMAVRPVDAAASVANSGDNSVPWALARRRT